MVGPKTIIAAVILVIVAGVFYVALGDEPLDPEAAKWLTPPAAVAIADAENGYVVTMGIIAAATEQPSVVGADRINGWAQATVDPDTGIRQWNDYPEASRIASPSECPIRKCLVNRQVADLAAAASDLPALLSEHGLLLARYRSLSALTHYATGTPVSMDGLIVPGQHLMAGNRLMLAQVAHHYLKGRRGEALRLLGEEIGNTRRHLALADDLLYKMIRLKMLQNDLFILSMLLDHHLPPPVVDARIKEGLGPLTTAEHSLQMAIRGEFLGISSLMVDDSENPRSLFAMSGVPSWAMGFLFKPNRSINRAYADLAWVANGSELAAPQWVAARDAHVPWEPTFVDYASNYVGTVLAGIANPQFHTYVDRFHDLDGLLGLVRAKMHILGAGIPDEKIADALAAPDMPRNPYTGVPVGWDAAQREIFFEGSENDSEAVRRLPILKR